MNANSELVWIDRNFPGWHLYYILPAWTSVNIYVLVIYIDFFSRYIWQRENYKPAAKQDEDKEDLGNLDYSQQDFTKLPHPPNTHPIPPLQAHLNETA